MDADVFEPAVPADAPEGATAIALTLHLCGAPERTRSVMERLCGGTPMVQVMEGGREGACVDVRLTAFALRAPADDEADPCEARELVGPGSASSIPERLPWLLPPFRGRLERDVAMLDRACEELRRLHAIVEEVREYQRARADVQRRVTVVEAVRSAPGKGCVPGGDEGVVVGTEP